MQIWQRRDFSAGRLRLWGTRRVTSADEIGIDMERDMQGRGRVEFEEDGSPLDIVWTIIPEGDEILKSVTVVP